MNYAKTLLNAKLTLCSVTAAICELPGSVAPHDEADEALARVSLAGLEVLLGILAGPRPVPFRLLPVDRCFRFLDNLSVGQCYKSSDWTYRVDTGSSGTLAEEESERLVIPAVPV